MKHCTGKLDWPKRGMYFFFEHGELRTNQKMLRVTRVGTHAVREGSKTSLWKRLRDHRGTTRGERVGGGNHRGSIFRRHIGTALLKKEKLETTFPSWGKGSSAAREIINKEYPIEQKVSHYIGNMPFLWLKVDDLPNKYSKRAYLERNAIALLSNCSRNHIDTASSEWLGHHCKHPVVKNSGLWNVNHVNDTAIDADFLDILESKIVEMK